MTAPRVLWWSTGAAGQRCGPALWINDVGLTTGPGTLFANVRNGVLSVNGNLMVYSAGGEIVPNQWSHVALTFDYATHTAILYHNGAQVGSATSPDPIHPWTSVPVGLGYRNVASLDVWAGQRFAGRLDEISIYNRALTQSEIQAIYNAGSSGKCPPDPLLITPAVGFDATGCVGGPFSTTNDIFSLINTGTNSLDWSLANTSPWLDASPTNGTLAVGETTNVTVSLNSGANSLALGSYIATVWFTNLNDGVGQSRQFTLTVGILSQPQSLIVCDGSPASFSVSVCGTLPLYYQWQKNGSNLTDVGNIFGSATTNLLLSSTTFNDAGNYTVIITNTWGSVTSSVAMLSVQNCLPFYEPFSEWGQNEVLGQAGSSGNVWSYGDNATSLGAKITTNAALGYFGLAPDTNSPQKGLRSHSDYALDARGAPFTPVTNGTVYASFLLNVKTNPMANVVFVALSGASSGTNCTPFSGVYIDSLRRLTISKNSSSFSAGGPPYTAPLITNSTYLVVLRYKFNPDTGVDEFALWLNPTSLGNDSVIPAPTISTTDGANMPIIQSFAYVYPSSWYYEDDTLAFSMDELRVATNWAGVTPLPPPGWPPSCSGAVFNVTNLSEGSPICAPVDVGLDGSDPGAVYWLARNGVYAGMTVPGNADESGVDFGTQTISGVYTVLASNITTTCVGWMNGSVTVKTNPNIITQPIDTLVVTNGQAVIYVVASGNGLAFQWRKNGVLLTNNVGHYFGVTTSNLIIYPATTDDAATADVGYDCVISGSCGSPVPSDMVALTLTNQTNLYWYGNLPGDTNVWDVAATLDWSTLPTAFPDSVFNYGRNVIFNEYAFPVSPIILASPNLTPTRVTVDNDFDVYSFSGPGSISGSNSALFKINTGMLLISNANNYAGGTTISNGTIAIYNNSALGVGTINLAGGRLNTMPNPTTLNNPINLLSSSVIGVGNSGSSALVLYGPSSVLAVL